MGLIGPDWGEVSKSVASRRSAKEQAKLGKEQYKAQQHALQGHDWNPEYVSQHAPQFQRTESPVARSFLESFLTGDNQAMMQGTRAGAQFDKADAQNRFDHQYGGWDALRARQAEIENDPTRFMVSPIERTIEAPDSYDWGPITKKEERKDRRKKRREKRSNRREERRERRRNR